MTEKWVISDTHFGHANIIKFTKSNGEPIRPGFSNRITRDYVRFKDIQHHDETLIAHWNRDIMPNHKVYMLGDFGKPLDILARLNGKKRLILGNHDDIHDAADLAKYFDKITVVRHFRNEFVCPVIFSHYPLHRDERHPAPRLINVHGHIHEKQIMKDCMGGACPDPWYINVCVEHTNHAPLHFDDLAKIVANRYKAIGE